MLLALDPFGQPVGERRQVEEEVLGLLKTGGVPSIFERGLIRSIGSSWLPQLSHWSPRASLKPQIGQVPFDVAVGQRVAGRRRERPQRRLLDDVAVLVEGPEQVLHDPVVVARRRAREQVVREAEVTEVLADDLAVAVGSLTRRQTFAIGRDHDGRSVLVGAADHQHVDRP